MSAKGSDDGADPAGLVLKVPGLNGGTKEGSTSIHISHLSFRAEIQPRERSTMTVMTTDGGMRAKVLR